MNIIHLFTLSIQFNSIAKALLVLPYRSCRQTFYRRHKKHRNSSNHPPESFVHHPCLTQSKMDNFNQEEDRQLYNNVKRCEISLSSSDNEDSIEIICVKGADGIQRKDCSIKPFQSLECSNTTIEGVTEPNHSGRTNKTEISREQLQHTTANQSTRYKVNQSDNVKIKKTTADNGSNQHSRLMLLLIGIPGSGKSNFTEKLVVSLLAFFTLVLNKGGH